MPDKFDELKEMVESFYPEYKTWVEKHYATLPPFISGVLTIQESITLLIEILETMNIVLKNKEQCVKYVSRNEIDSIYTCLSGIVDIVKQNNILSIGKAIDDLIPHIRPFQVLFMEKMDEKRYREVSDMDKVLSDIRTIQISATSMAQKMEVDSAKVRKLIKSTEKKGEELIIMANESSQRMDHLQEILGQTKESLSHINNILNHANEQKSKIDNFVNLIQKGEEKIISQNAATEKYKEKLKEFSEKYDLNMGEATKLIDDATQLIDDANEALNLSTARGLGKAFYTRQQKLEHRGVKFAWLSMGLSAIGGALFIGIEFFDKGIEINIENVVLRTLLMMVLIGVAAFCSRQYAKNRSFEEDYAYKVALVASYPGLAKEFKDAEEMRKEYVVKLLGEILQDPQRTRHDKESLIDSHSLMAELKKFMKKKETKTDKSKKDKEEPPNP